MNYPENIVKILYQELEVLKNKIEKEEFPFHKNFIMEWYNKYKTIEGENNA
jgi:protein associated with RNAse G/E